MENKIVPTCYYRNKSEVELLFVSTHLHVYFKKT